MPWLKSDTPTLIIAAAALILALWLLFDTKTLLFWLSLRRRESFDRWQITFLRIDAAIVALGTFCLLAANLVRWLRSVLKH